MTQTIARNDRAAFLHGVPEIVGNTRVIEVYRWDAGVGGRYAAAVMVGEDIMRDKSHPARFCTAVLVYADDHAAGAHWLMWHGDYDLTLTKAVTNARVRKP